MPDTSAVDDAGQADVDAGPVDAAVALDASDARPDVPPDATPGPQALRLPQAVAGALQVNALLRPTASLRIDVTGEATRVTATLDGDEVEARRSDGGWVAPLRLGARDDGDYALRVTAQGGGAEAAVDATLRIARDGVQLTAFDEHGTARTPRLHRVDDRLWLTWSDKRAAESRVWMQELDGAGRLLGDPAPLVLVPGEEAVAARVAIGAERIAVLYQLAGTPYRNFLLLTDRERRPIGEAQPLDPEGMRGSFGGDVAYDGTAFDVVWRCHDDQLDHDVRWLRVDEATGAQVGPVVVAATGEGDPDGGFDGISWIRTAAGDGVSAVSFVRRRFDGLMDMEIPRAQLGFVEHDGTLRAPELMGTAMFWFETEAHVFRHELGLLGVWVGVNLLDETEQPPQQLLGRWWSHDGSTRPGTPPVLAVGSNDRGEVTLVSQEGHASVLAWSDYRAVIDDADLGSIDVWAAPLQEDLSVGQPAAFEHSVLWAGLGQLHGAPAGGNAVLVWVDQRHSGALDPRPELWLDTLWID